MLNSVVTKLNKLICHRHISSRNVKGLKFVSAPIKTKVGESQLVPKVKIDDATIEELERISLVGFENDRGIEIVESAIAFANQIFEVDTTDVKPLVSVLEDECLRLRDDVVKNDVSRNELLSHCKVSIENYFVTPVGNVSYVPKGKLEEKENPNPILVSQ